MNRVRQMCAAARTHASALLVVGIAATSLALLCGGHWIAALLLVGALPFIPPPAGKEKP